MPLHALAESPTQIAALAEYLDARAAGEATPPSSLDPAPIATDRRLRALDRFGQAPAGTRDRIWDDVAPKTKASADADVTTALADARNHAVSPPWKRTRFGARRWFVPLDVAAVALLLMATLVLGDRIRREDADDLARPGLAAASPQASVRPQRLLIESIGVEAEIVAVDEIDPAAWMPLDDPWRVAWAEASGAPGLPGNAVMAGHLDYWAVGPAVFWDLRHLVPGDRIVVVGDDGRAYHYEVEWVRHYEVDQLTAGPARAEVVGPTDDPALTLITEGGAFSFQEGEYLGRTVVRASLVGLDPADATPGKDASSEHSSAPGTPTPARR
jgi:hypothetical protein